MAAAERIGARMLDDERMAGCKRLKTESRIDRQLSARRQPEMNVVLDGARGPGLVRDSCHHGDPHSGDLAQNLEERRHDIDTTYDRARIDDISSAIVQVIHFLPP
jgi:hypothetical protein